MALRLRLPRRFRSNHVLRFEWQESRACFVGISDSGFVAFLYPPADGGINRKWVVLDLETLGRKTGYCDSGAEALRQIVRAARG